MALLVFVLSLSVPSAKAWWNEDWQYRRTIDINTTAGGVTTALQGHPLLIRLHSGNFDFTTAGDDGADLRFIGSNDTEPLKFFIESYDPLDELAFIWVKPTTLPVGAATVYLYYGNPEAAPASDPAGIYDVAQTAAFHFSEMEGLPQDSTAYGNNADDFVGAQGLPSIIGNGITLNGSDRMIIAPAPSLQGEEFSFSTWVRSGEPLDNAPLLLREGEGVRLSVLINQGSLQVALDHESTIYSFSSFPLTLNTWHHIFLNLGGGNIHLYVDGKDAGSTEIPAVSPAALNGKLQIGGMGGEGGGRFYGELDELHLGSKIRSSDWIMFSHANEAPGSSLAGIGPEQVREGGGLPVFYLATIAGNISMDGWMIIGILMVISAMSWLVLFLKGYLYHNMREGNKKFHHDFDALSEVVPLEDLDEKYKNSPLFVIYKSGVDCLNGSEKGTGNSGDPALNRDLLNHFEFVIERSYIHESQRMNNWLSILTMAISGGPFLGLLGTVWGVMNTFAAMAEAGEANIMAIAPGVASALATTVFGLIVAIPALFGYNYLVGRMKAITAEMNIFLDEFAIKVKSTMFIK